MTKLKRLYARFLAWQRSGRIRREARVARQQREIRQALVNPCYIEGRRYWLSGSQRPLPTPLLTDEGGETLIGHTARSVDEWPEILTEGE